MSIKPLTTQEDQRMHRLWNPKTRCYLHLSGAGETDDVSLSWLGFAYQADTLRQRAKVRGEAWAYQRTQRNAHLANDQRGGNDLEL